MLEHAKRCNNLIMEKEIKFQVMMKVPYMFDFLMKNAYQGIKGIAGIAVSVGAFILYLKGFGNGDALMNALLIVIAVLMVINPPYLYYKALKQVKLNKNFQKPLNYTVNDAGITVGQETEEGTIPWDAVVYVTETRKSVLIYFSKRIAYIFPKDELNENYDAFKEMVKAKVPAQCIKKM